MNQLILLITSLCINLNKALPFKFKFYFKNEDKVHEHLSRLFDFFYLLIYCRHGYKFLPYQGSKLWTDMLNDLNHDQIVKY